MAKIEFSPEALTDIKDIKKYIADELSNEIAALNTVKKITEKIRELEDFPQMGASLSVNVNFDTDYRFIVCGNYMAFYRIEKEKVRVVRIVYGRRDFMRVLFEK